MTRSRQPICFIAGLMLGLFFGYGACYVPAKAATGTRVCVSDAGPALIEVGRGYLTHRGGSTNAAGVTTYRVELDVREWKTWVTGVTR